jgi:hypothetical protein
MCPRTAMKSNMVPPSAALRIDYLSILWVGKCVSQERGVGGNSPQCVGLTLELDLSWKRRYMHSLCASGHE